jgi:hypothetical protein
MKNNMTRKESNSIILGIIADAIQKCPDMRFGQILANLNIIQYEQNTYDDSVIALDPFNVESSKMLENIKKSTLFNRLYKK